MSNEYTIESDGKIARLEKRGRGFRRLITAINDLPLLEQVTYPIAVDPDEKLQQHATTNGWEIISLRT